MDKIQKELEEQTHLLRSIRNSMRIGTYISLLKVLVIVVPLILAFIYLPALFRQYSESFQEGFFSTGNMVLPEGFDFSQINQFFERK